MKSPSSALRVILRRLCLTVAGVAVVTSAAGTSAAQVTRKPDVGYEPTPQAAVEAMLRMAHVGPDDVVYDLGSGDGRIVITAARMFGARGVGIELQPELIQASRKAARDAVVADRVTFVQDDFFEVNLSEATVVTSYLFPSVNDRLEPKLRRELRAGARIVSYSFPMGAWVPEQTELLANGRELFLWTVPRPPARAPDVPFVPTPQGIIEEMIALANVGPDDVVFDLGSGDGRAVIVAAQKYGAKGVGIEIVPKLVEISRQVAQQAELTDKVTFVEGDLFDADLSRATVVVLCLSAGVNARLETRLRGLRPGTRILSRQFPIGAWAPDKIVHAQDGSPLFLWIVPTEQAREATKRDSDTRPVGHHHAMSLVCSSCRRWKPPI
jgi:predicted RNA methylase